jgi:hypothetical protein
MELLPEEIRKTLPPPYSQEHVQDPIAAIKILAISLPIP